MKWEKYGEYSYEPTFKIKCKGCKDPKAVMQRKSTLLLRFPLEVKDEEVFDAHAQDIGYHCNLCGYRAVFGVAISKKKFEECYGKGQEKKCAELPGR